MEAIYEENEGNIIHSCEVAILISNTGDIRAIINSLQFLCINQERKSEKKGTKKTKAKTKDKDKDKEKDGTGAHRYDN